MTTTELPRTTAADGYAPSRLLPAEDVRRPNTVVAAGPFGIASAARARASGTAGAMLTALMIVYPAFATVAVIAIGLLLSGKIV